MKNSKFLNLLVIAFGLFFISPGLILAQDDTSSNVNLVSLNYRNVGTGSGLVTNNGGTPSTAYAEGTTQTLTATPDQNSKFMGWLGDCDNGINNASDFTCVVKLDKTKNVAAVFNSSAVVNSPRIMYWYGKVNQHWDLNSQSWQTDSDGTSGANIDELTYCKKFYPQTYKTYAYKEEVSTNWKAAGNIGNYISIKTSYLCVQPENNNAPRIMYWYGKVNQHLNINTQAWETDSDGTSGANIDTLTYCQKFYPETAKVETYKEESINSWRAAGNIGAYSSNKVSYLCLKADGSAPTTFNNVTATTAATSASSSVSNTNQNYNYNSFSNNPYLYNRPSSTSYAPVSTTNAATSNNNVYTNSNAGTSSNQSSVLAELNSLRNKVQEQANQIKYLNSLLSGVKNISDDAKVAINNFITYGADSNTKKLGAGERAAVVSSYKAAYNKLPETTTEVSETVKIANGRFPSVISETAEAKAKVEFAKIYGRDMNPNNKNDVAAIKIMAYGLRQKAENRNLSSEQQGITTFKNIYGHAPKTTEEWNIMQAITYSGAAR